MMITRRSFVSTSLVVVAWFVVELHAECTQKISHAYLSGATAAEYPGTCERTTRTLNADTVVILFAHKVA